MEPISFIVLLVPLTGIWMIKKAIDEGRKMDAQIAPMRPIEEEIEVVLARIRQERRNRRKKDIENWEDAYFRSLPVTEHPDYFKLDPATDEVEGFVQKAADGTIVSKFESRTSASGIPYWVKLDHVTKTIHVHTSRIFWSVPFSEVDNYTQYM